MSAKGITKRPLFLGRTTVDVEIDVRDVLDTIDRDDLCAYMAERFGEADKEPRKEVDAFVRQVEDLLTAGRNDEALLLVQRWQRPKFESPIACLKALAASKASTSRQLS